MAITLGIRIKNWLSAKSEDEIVLAPSEHAPKERMNIIKDGQLVASVTYREMIGALVEFKEKVSPSGLILPPQGHRQELTKN